MQWSNDPRHRISTPWFLMPALSGLLHLSTLIPHLAVDLHRTGVTAVAAWATGIIPVELTPVSDHAATAMQPCATSGTVHTSWTAQCAASIVHVSAVTSLRFESASRAEYTCAPNASSDPQMFRVYAFRSHKEVLPVPISASSASRRWARSKHDIVAVVVHHKRGLAQRSGIINCLPVEPIQSHLDCVNFDTARVHRTPTMRRLHNESIAPARRTGLHKGKSCCFFFLCPFQPSLDDSHALIVSFSDGFFPLTSHSCIRQLPQLYFDAKSVYVAIIATVIKPPAGSFCSATSSTVDDC